MELVNEYEARTFDKLLAIRGGLVRTDPAWESWVFVKLADAFQLWTTKNQVDDQERENTHENPMRKGDRSSKLYYTQQHRYKQTFHK